VIPLRDANPTRRTPYVTIAIIVACFLVFAYELYLQASGGDGGFEAFLTEHGLVPARLTDDIARGALDWVVLATVLTSMFLHGNIEDRLGRPGFVLFYLSGGLAAVLAQVAIDPRSQQPLIGASGAIAAVLGAYLVLYPGARILSLVFLGFFYQLIPVPALVVLGFWFVLQIVDGFTSLGGPSANAGGVAFFAHIGGFALGLVVGVLIRLRRQPRYGVG